MYIRGDFYVCPNPLSLDPYSICPYDCVFCFVKEMEQTMLKRKASKGFRPTSLDEVETKLRRAFNREREYNDPVVRALRESITVIIGRKTEPLSHLDQQNTIRAIRLLKDYNYPMVIETKGYIAGDLFKLLSEAKVGINISVTPGSDELARKLEPGLPVYSERFRLAKELREIGIWVGIKSEPIIPSVNDNPSDIDRFVENCVEAGVNHDMTAIIRAKKAHWVKIGRYIFDKLRSAGMPVTSPDWVNFGLVNSCESCCGLDGSFPFHKFTLQHALNLIKQKGRVTLEEMAKFNIFGDEYFEKFRKVWNNKENRYYSLADVKGIKVVGYDDDNNKIYGKARDVTGVFG